MRTSRRTRLGRLRPRSLPLLAICPNGHRRTVPFRLLKTSEDDRTPLYGRPFKCKACGSHEVILFAIESQAELEEIRRATTNFYRHPRTSAILDVRGLRPSPAEPAEANAPAYHEPCPSAVLRSEPARFGG